MIARKSMKDMYQDILTPSMVSRIYGKAVSTSLEKAHVIVKGIYQATGKKPYNNFYFDTIKDELGGEVMIVKVHEILRAKMHEGNTYTLRGVIETQINQGGRVGITLAIIPQEIMGMVKPEIDEKLEKTVQLFRDKASKRDVDVDKILMRKIFAGEKPRITIIYGNEGIVDKDVAAGLQGLGEHYQLQELRTSLSDAKSIITALKKAEPSSDVICVARGGGSGLEVFDNIELAAAVISLRCGTISSVGHAADSTLFRQICDKRFATPTALGNYLRDIAQDVQRGKVDAKVIDAVKIETRESLKGMFWASIISAAVTAFAMWYFLV